MKGKELRELVNSGINPVVEFTDTIEELEMRWEKGMKGYVFGVSEVDKGGCVLIKIEEREFVDYNKLIEKSIWRKDIDGEYIYKWSEVHKPHQYYSDYEFYEEENKETYNIEIISDEKLKLFKQYSIEKKDNMTYIEWLENKILNKED